MDENAVRQQFEEIEGKLAAHQIVTATLLREVASMLGDRSTYIEHVGKDLVKIAHRSPAGTRKEALLSELIEIFETADKE